VECASWISFVGSLAVKEEDGVVVVGVVDWFCGEVVGWRFWTALLMRRVERMVNGTKNRR
jgi:hypothetical protein